MAGVQRHKRQSSPPKRPSHVDVATLNAQRRKIHALLYELRQIHAYADSWQHPAYEHKDVDAYIFNVHGMARCLDLCVESIIERNKYVYIEKQSTKKTGVEEMPPIDIQSPELPHSLAAMARRGSGSADNGDVLTSTSNGSVEVPKGPKRSATIIRSIVRSTSQASSSIDQCRFTANGDKLTPRPNDSYGLTSISNGRYGSLQVPLGPKRSASIKQSLSHVSPPSDLCKLTDNGDELTSRSNGGYGSLDVPMGSYGALEWSSSHVSSLIDLDLCRSTDNGGVLTSRSLLSSSQSEVRILQSAALQSSRARSERRASKTSEFVSEQTRALPMSSATSSVREAEQSPLRVRAPPRHQVIRRASRIAEPVQC